MSDRRKFLKQSFAFGGASLIITPHANSAVGVGQQPKSLLGYIVDAVIDFGCDNTGVSNTTTQLKAFYEACISNGTNGFIPAGTYLISEGELVFDTAFVDKPWPNIYTAGHQFVSFKFAGVVDAPLLTWSNGVADSPAGKYWIGGGHGGLTFIGSHAHTYSKSSAISISGIWGFKFGWMKGIGLSGDLVYLPSKRLGGNPDPYACSFIEFDGLEANNCTGKIVNNCNFVGLNIWKVKYLRAVNGKSGVWYGFGAGVEIEAVSIGTCRGWAFEDSSTINESDGPGSRFYIKYAELDNVQFGFQINRLSMFELNGIRFIHRFNSGGMHKEGYWPRIAFDFAGGKKASITSGRINCTHRLEVGGDKSDMGVFLSGNNNAGFTNCQIDQVVLDNANLGFSDQDLYTSINPASLVLLTKSGRTIYDMRDRTVIVVRGSVEDTMIGFSDFGLLSSKVSFGKKASINVQQTERYYDAGTSTFTAPFLGMYLIEVAIPLELPIGTKVKIGVANDKGLLASTTDYAQTKAINYFYFRSALQLSANEKIFVVAEQSTTEKVNASVTYLQNEISFTIIAL